MRAWIDDQGVHVLLFLSVSHVSICCSPLACKPVVDWMRGCRSDVCRSDGLCTLMIRKQEACRAKKRTHLSSDFLDTMQVNDCIVFGAWLLVWRTTLRLLLRRGNGLRIRGIFGGVDIDLSIVGKDRGCKYCDGNYSWKRIGMAGRRKDRSRSQRQRLG